ncbi:MAG TPA: response regulator [Rhodocyclaceae bacterium]|nr:response regulator [Rhodocyclaceae bacterium]
MPGYASANQFHASLQEAIVNESPDGILVVDRDDNIVSVNARFFTVWSIPQPLPGADGLHPLRDTPMLAQAVDRVADPEAFLARVQELYSHPEQDDVCEVRLKDGRTLQRHSKGLYDSDGEYLGRAWYFRDVTEIIQSRQALEKSEARYRTAFHTTQDAIAITLMEDGRYLDVNPAFLQMSGYEREELIGRTSFEIGIWASPEDRQAAAESVRSGAPLERIETLFRRKNGEVLWCIFSVSRMEVDGRPCLLSISRDISREKAAQEELEHHRLHLEQLVAERTAELNAAKESAVAASIAKSAFLANMSHEIRTPINAITGMAYLIRRGGLTPAQADQLRKLQSASEHLLNIINAVLDFSKIESGKLTIANGPIRLREVLDNVASMLHSRAQAKGLDFTLDCRDIPERLRGDATAIQQSLLNYGANAIKFTESGGVTLRVRVAGETAGDVELRFEVEDTGIGIPEEVLPRLFSAFEQADNSLTRQYGGTGLGLAITKRLAEMMGGTAGADSIQGRGSCFWFTARLGKETGAAENPGTTAAKPADALIAEKYSGRRVLLVEDEPVNRDIASMLLEDAGLRVDLAEDGMEAAEEAGKRRYDLILMDIQMPRLDGLEATQRIRALPGGADVPVVAMTANAFSEDRQRCLDAGMNDFIAKPFDPDAFFETILKWMEKRPVTPQA